MEEITFAKKTLLSNEKGGRSSSSSFSSLSSSSDLKEFCGVFGIYGHPEASKMTYLGLYALQHRGQESAGIISSDGMRLHHLVKMGLVADAFTQDSFKQLPGPMAIGHCRYSTTGSSTLENAQPICVTYARGGMAVAHNGNLVNALPLRIELERQGSIFSSTSDSEVVVHLIARSRQTDFTQSVIEALTQVKGAFSLVAMNESVMIAARDSYGFRPLSLGKLKSPGSHGEAWCVASETCAFDIIEAEYVRTLEPGEVVVITPNGLQSFFPFPKTRLASCVFEFIYFSRPDSLIFGKSCYDLRKQFGKELAKEHPVEADVVIPVPDSSTVAAIGYAEASGIPFDMGFIRNHYVGRTFIEPNQSIRDFGAKVKFNPIVSPLRGKRVVVVDDSIVRGTTSRKLVTMLKKAEPKEIHWRISSPPLVGPCYYGIDIPTKDELIASNKTPEEIRQYLGVQSLAYLSLERLHACLGQDAPHHCTACFSGDYPIPIEDPRVKLKFERTPH